MSLPGGYQLDPDHPSMSIAVAAELAGLHPQTLRMYERLQVVVPRRSKEGSGLFSGARRYSLNDVARIRRLRDLTECGVGYSAVAPVMALEANVAALLVQVAALGAEPVPLQEVTWERGPQPVRITRKRSESPGSRERKTELLEVLNGEPASIRDVEGRLIERDGSAPVYITLLQRLRRLAQEGLVTMVALERRGPGRAPIGYALTPEGRLVLEGTDETE